MLYLHRFLLFSFCWIPFSSSGEESPLYRSESLEIYTVSEGVYRHVSFLQTKEFGKVPCNGLVVVDGGEALILDTPTDGTASLELIEFVEQNLNAQIRKVVPTHFHVDCLGGLAAFHERSIPSTASKMTIGLARLSGKELPQEAFEEKTRVEVGAVEVIVAFAGAGHTKDNVVAFVRQRNVLFGGCLVKSMGAAKGNLADADLEAWPKSIDTVRRMFPDVEVVVPGHGLPGGAELLEYTKTLFTEVE